MHKIKEMLMKELYEYEEKAKKMSGGKISAGDLETLHKLTDTVKNIDKICLMEDDEDGEYSEAGGWMADGRMYGTYDNGSSYARGRGRVRGRNARRDSMGRYSREGGYSEEGYSEEGGSSYARGGQGGNRGGNRGGQGGMNRSSYRGGYSYGDAKDHMIDKLEEMLDMAETPRERKAIHRCIEQIEQA